MDPRAAVRQHWSWVETFVVLLALYAVTLVATVDTGNPNLVPSLLLLGALVVPATFVSFARGWSGPQLVPATSVVAAVFVGGAVGVVLAALLEYRTLQRIGTVPMLGVGLIEEGSKLLVAGVFLAVLHRYRSLGAGILVGVAVGTGFAVLETMGYGFVALLQSGGDLGALQQTLFIRGVTSPAGHAAWTGLTCWGLWGVVHQPSGRRLARAVGLFVVAVALHTAWDSLGTRTAYVVVAAISLGLLAVALRQARATDEHLASWTHAVHRDREARDYLEV